MLVLCPIERLLCIDVAKKSSKAIYQMSEESSQEPKESKAGERFELFEKAALEKLKTGSFTTNPAYFLPLPTKWTAITSSVSIVLGIIWAFTAKVPLQVKGVGAIVPETPVISVSAEVDGRVNFLISGHGDNSIDQLEKSNIEKLEKFWSYSLESKNNVPDYDYLEKISLLATKSNPSQKPVLNYLSLEDSNNYKEPIFYQGGKFILQIFNDEINENLKSVSRLAGPNILIDQIVEDESKQREIELEAMIKQKADQINIQSKELDQRIALLERYEILASQGVVSKESLLSKRAEVNNLKNNLLRLDLDQSESNFRKVDQVENKKRATLAMLTERSNLKNKIVGFMKQTYSITPPSGMYLFNVSTRPGIPVVKGQELYTYTKQRPELPKVIPIFVDSASMQQIGVGQEVIVTPRGISRSRFGGIKGNVIQISKLPMSVELIAKYAGGQTMAESIKSLKSQTYMITVSLDTSTDGDCTNFESRDCYLWSSGRYPSFPVRLGTLADSQITVERKTPVEFIVPVLRQVFGFELEN